MESRKSINLEDFDFSMQVKKLTFHELTNLCVLKIRKFLYALMRRMFLIIMNF